MYSLAHQFKHYMQKTKFTTHKQYLCCLLFSRNVKTNVQTRVYYYFLYSLSLALSLSLSLSLSEKKRLANLQMQVQQQSFSLVYILLVQLTSINAFYYVMTGRHYFLEKLTATLRAFPAALLLRLKEVRILPLHNRVTV